MGGVFPELRPSQLTDDVLRGPDQLERRSLVEKKRRFRHPEIHRPVDRLVQLGDKRRVALLGERGVVALADGGDHGKRNLTTD